MNADKTPLESVHPSPILPRRSLANRYHLVLQNVRLTQLQPLPSPGPTRVHFHPLPCRSEAPPWAFTKFGNLLANAFNHLRTFPSATPKPACYSVIEKALLARQEAAVSIVRAGAHFHRLARGFKAGTTRIQRSSCAVRPRVGGCRKRRSQWHTPFGERSSSRGVRNRFPMSRRRQRRLNAERSKENTSNVAKTSLRRFTSGPVRRCRSNHTTSPLPRNQTLKP